MGQPEIGRHSLLRRLNHGAVLELLAGAGEMLSRVEIAEELTLSQASVSRIVDALLEAELIREMEPRSVGHGRPQVPLGINESAAHVVTVDLRRDSYRLRLTDLCGGVLADECSPQTGAGKVTTAEAAVAHVLELLVAAQEKAAVTSPLAALVVGLSAAWDEAARRVYAARNLRYLEGVNLRSLIEARLPVPIRVANDVKLGAIGELATGSAVGKRDFYYLSLGSGVAGAGVVAGQVHGGVSGFAGELGYLRLRTADGDWTDLETVSSRGALELRWQALAGSEPLAFGLARKPANVEEHRYREDLLNALLMALTAITALNDPPLLVLGGSLGVQLGPVLEELDARLAATVPAPPALQISGVGSDAALVGGTRLGQELARAELLGEVLS